MLSIQEMMDLDLAHIERRSIWVDLFILIKTPPVVRTGCGAS
jgi:lipopolysaccharide/colanic/teichoic acid biosynthesis glycosyltransferase